MNRLHTWMFRAAVGTLMVTVAWMPLGMAIAFSVPSLRDAPGIPLWYLLPLVCGCSATALLLLGELLLLLIEDICQARRRRARAS